MDRILPMMEFGHSDTPNLLGALGQLRGYAEQSLNGIEGKPSFESSLCRLNAIKKIVNI